MWRCTSKSKLNICLDAPASDLSVKESETGTTVLKPAARYPRRHQGVWFWSHSSLVLMTVQGAPLMVSSCRDSTS